MPHLTSRLFREKAACKEANVCTICPDKKGKTDVLLILFKILGFILAHFLSTWPDFNCPVFSALQFFSVSHLNTS